VRGQELLAALALKAPGIEMHMTPWPCATVATLYEPNIKASGQTLFDAAFEVARQMLYHSQCPPEVRAALEDYDKHTHILQI